MTVLVTQKPAPLTRRMKLRKVRTPEDSTTPNGPKKVNRAPEAAKPKAFLDEEQGKNLDIAV